ncbi:MAG: glycosyltransferase family protein, partial [Magnetococcales bacterium]|nr:glycosyltransferase family protein [Magnetococcales bacterium]
MMDVTAIIQARMGASRLPGKVLLPMGERSVLGRVIHRVASCERISRVVVATSDRALDDAVEVEATKQGAKVFRGSEEDVLARFHGTLETFGGAWIVRVTADCPLLDGGLLCAMLTELEQRLHRGESVHYLSNTQTRTYPRGLDAEIVSADALRQAHSETSDLFDRVHVTPYFYRNPERFHRISYDGLADKSSHRWTLDAE